MKTVNVSINLYQFDELEVYAKDLAISEHRTFLINVFDFGEFDFGEFENEELAKESMNELMDSDLYVIENIKANEYWFFENGKLAEVTQYTDKHPKAGKTEFKYEGKIYEI